MLLMLLLLLLPLCFSAACFQLPPSVRAAVAAAAETPKAMQHSATTRTTGSDEEGREVHATAAA